MKILAIDPGNIQSAYILWDGKEILSKNIIINETLIDLLQHWPDTCQILIVEQIRSYGMPVGATIFDTVFWSGRFCQAWPGDFYQLPRMDVKNHLCHNSRAKDSNIRQALIDRFEPDLKPRQRPKGVLEGLVKDLWAAMGVAVTWFDQNK